MKSVLDKERLHENLLASIEEGVIVLDPDYSIVTFNQGAEGITGVSEGLSIGNRLSQVLREPEIGELARKAYETGKSFSDNDLAIRRRDGTLVSVSITASPLLDEDGKALGTVVVLRDIGRIKALEEDLRRSDRLGTMGTLAAGLAHEIKNPLGGIKGAAQLLEEELEDKRLKEYTGIIIRETERVNRLIEELLDFAKPKRLSLKPMNIHKTLDDTILLMSEAMRSRTITVYKEFDPSLPLIKGDGGRLSQVFLNVIKNAVEALDRGGWLMVSTRMVTDYLMVEGEERKGAIVVEVSDNGRGMDQETLDRLFTPFFSTREKGTGLGLAISHRVIKEHKGNIKVRSRLGEGTTVSVTLPVN
jgi:two-component system nitrogen regulation sensor histidine kinase GlnL